MTQKASSCTNTVEFTLVFRPIGSKKNQVRVMHINAGRNQLVDNLSLPVTSVRKIYDINVIKKIKEHDDTLAYLEDNQCHELENNGHGCLI